MEMDQQTPPRTPVLGGSTPDEELKKLQDGLETRGLGLSGHIFKSASVPSSLELSTSIATLTSPTPSTMASAGQLLLSPKTVLYGKAATRVIKLLQSANGLDKIIRSIQYTSRLLSHIMLLKNIHTDSTSTASKAIRRQFGLTRRLLRCFNNIGQLNATINLIRQGRQRIRNDFVGYMLDLIEGIGYTGFGVADSLGYLPEAGIVGIPYRSMVDTLAFHFWLYALIASILGGLVKTWRLRQRLGKYKAIFPGTTVTPQAVIEPTSQEVETSKDGGEEPQKMLQVQVLQKLPPTPPDSPIPTTQISVEDAARSVVKGLEEQQLNTALNVVGYVADILFPLAALKVNGFSTLSDGVLGFAGCVSSVVGMRKAWKATV